MRVGEVSKREPQEGFALAWARCHGSWTAGAGSRRAGPRGASDDASASCAEVGRSAAPAALNWGRGDRANPRPGRLLTEHSRRSHSWSSGTSIWDTVARSEHPRTNRTPTAMEMAWRPSWRLGFQRNEQWRGLRLYSEFHNGGNPAASEVAHRENSCVEQPCDGLPGS